MKKLIPSLVLMLLVSSLVLAQKKSDRERDDLIGAVRSVRTEVAKISEINGRSVEGQRVLSNTLTYDAQGNRSELALYDENGSLQTRVVYERDPKENRLAGWATYNDKSVLIRRVSYVYNDMGLVTKQEQINYDSDGSFLIKRILSFDSSGGLASVAEFDVNGSPIEKVASNPEGVEQQPEKRNDDTDASTFRLAVSRNAETLDEDSHRNWVKKRRAERIRKPQQTYEDNRMIYRTITYYQ